MRTLCVVAIVAASNAAAPVRDGLDQPVRVAGGLVTGVRGRDASIAVFEGLPFARR